MNQRYIRAIERISTPTSSHLVGSIQKNNNVEVLVLVGYSFV